MCITILKCISNSNLCKILYATKNFLGENVEPFCARPKRPYCSPDFRGASEIFNKCAPVYYSSQPPQTSCSVFSRCRKFTICDFAFYAHNTTLSEFIFYFLENVNDTVIHNEDNSKSADGTSNGMIFIFIIISEI